MTLTRLHRVIPWSLLAVVAVLALGAATGRRTDAAPVAQSGCEQHVAALEELLAARGMAAREGEEQELPVEEIIATLRACWEEFEPQLPRAEEDCEAYKELAPRVLGWSRQVSLLSLDAEFAAEQEYVMPWVVRSLVNCFNEAFDKCVEQHDITQANEMRTIQRQLALMGAEGEIDQSKYEKCLRFDVVFDSSVNWTVPGDVFYRYQVRATIPVQGAGLDFRPRPGAAPLEYPVGEWGGSSCGGSGRIESQGTANATVELDFEAAAATGSGPVRAVTLDFTLNPETLQIDTSQCRGPLTLLGSFWGGFLAEVHPGELVSSARQGCQATAASFTFRDLRRGSGAVLGETTLNGTGSCGPSSSITATTTVKLVHRPQP